MPATPTKQQTWFEAYFGNADRRRYQELARNRKKTLVYKSGFSPIGLFRNCMCCAPNESTKLPGAFAVSKVKFPRRAAATCSRR